MRFIVVIINLVGVITPWHCARLRNELVLQCHTTPISKKFQVINLLLTDYNLLTNDIGDQK